MFVDDDSLHNVWVLFIVNLIKENMKLTKLIHSQDTWLSNKQN